MTNKILPVKKTVWKYGLLHLAAFLFILLVIDIVIGAVLHHYYFTMKSGVQYRTTYAIEKTTADVLVFGSSRAIHHYKPDAFEDQLKLSFYNAGRDGEESSLFHYAVLKGVLKRYTPKIIILDLMNGELGKTLYSYDRLASISPYYKTHPEMRPIIEMRSNNEKIKMISGIYPFNSLLMSIISGNLDKEGKKNKDVKGYLPVPSTSIITKPIQPVVMSDTYELDSIKLNVLRSFIKDCTDAHIRLYIVCSPYYERHIGTDLSITTIKKMAAAFQVNFFDFSTDNFFLQHPELFGDPWHLNDNGADIFSKMMVDKIIQAEKSNKIQ
jgi:hypothetical protein